MKKLFMILSVAAMFSFGTVNSFAQDAVVADSIVADSIVADTLVADTLVAGSVTLEDAVNPEVDVEGQPLHQIIKQKFLEGGAAWMAPVLLCLVLGLAIIIERVIYLNLATTNTTKLIENVEAALASGGIVAAQEVCRNTRGPVASIFYQGLERYDEGIDVVEKTVVSYGSVQMGQMESGLSWIGLFISLAPMLGFMGTVVGMIEAFDSIQAMGDVSPVAVAGGIKVALLTTLAGLLAAVVLQLFYNYIVSKIDGLVISMEDASISLVDILTKYGKK